MSVDGFIAGPEHDMSWTAGAEYDISSALADQMARRAGVVLAGRGWFEVARADEGGALAGIYGGDWAGPVVVVTHRPQELAAAPGIEPVGDLEHGLVRARELAGDKDVGIFGGDLAGQVLARGLLDELVVQIVPIVLGDGVPLVGRRASACSELARIDVGTSGRLTDIRFRVLRDASDAAP